MNWIKTDQELPDIDHRVLCVACDIVFVLAMRDGGKWSDNGIYFDDCEVTHWMPVPAEGWIKADREQPMDKRDVLCLLNGLRLEILNRSRVNNIDGWHGPGVSVQEWAVTDWQELPELP